MRIIRSHREAAPWRALRLALLTSLGTGSALLCCPQVSAQAAPPLPKPHQGDAVLRLQPGQTIEKTLAGGAGDSFEIQVVAQQFLHVVVDQLGIDVAVVLYDSSSKKMAASDSLNGAWGPECVSMIAPESGLYRLEVASGDSGVPAGRYRVLIDPLRVPADADRSRISAEKLYFDAGQDFSRGDADSLRRAAQEFEATLPTWRRLNEKYNEAVALFGIGRVHEVLGEKQAALDYYGQSVTLARTIHAQGIEAQVANTIGLVHSSLGEQEQAILDFRQALTLAREFGDRRVESGTLGNIANAYNNMGEEQKSLDYYNQGLAAARALGFRYEEANILSDIGTIFDNLGQSSKALDYYQQALPLRRAVGDLLGESTTLNNIGHAYLGLGDNQRALDNFDLALALARSTGDRSTEAIALTNIGNVYDALGEGPKAVNYYNQALTLARAVGDRDGEAIMLNNVGRTLSELGDRPTALEDYSRALALARQVQDPFAESDILSSLMSFWRRAGQPEAAIFMGKQSINKTQQIRASISGFEKNVQQDFLKSKYKRYRNLADLLIAEGRLPEAQQVLDLLKNEQYFDFVRGDEKQNSSALRLNLTKSEDKLSRAYEENAKRVTAIGNEWAALRQKPNRTPEEEKHIAELSQQLKDANDAWQKFLSGLYAELGKSKEAQNAVVNVQESASGMQRILRQLNRDATGNVVALYTLVGDDKYRVIVVTPAVMVAREYPIKAEELREKVFEFREALVNPKSNPVPKAQELYRILVGPVEGDLAGAKAETLMWSLDDVLRYVPMAALHDGQCYLVEKFRNEVFTPASIASLTERPQVANWRGLGMGVSRSYGDFSALPAVPEELHRIIRQDSPQSADGVLPGVTMLDDGFTESSMKAALEQNYPLVHIASHFDFEAGNETDSFLLLGGKDAQGERLTLAEMRRDPAFNFEETQLLTLSACNTAVGGSSRDGREVDGLGILAQQKGARAVVASLWGVYDSSTGLLMEDFYRSWAAHRNMTKGEALREAQLALLRGNFNVNEHDLNKAPADADPDSRLNKVSTPLRPYAHPYYWAPFILIGNWL